MSEPRRPVVEPEWVISDPQTLRKAVRGTMRKRKLNQAALGELMQSSSTAVLSNFLNEKTDNMRSDTLMRVFLAMGFEIVVREPKESALQRRLAATRAEKFKLKAAATPAEDDGIDPNDPEAEFKKRVLGGIIDPKLREDLILVFKQARDRQ